MSMSKMSGASCAPRRSILSARKSWCESNDPDFAAKAAEIVGLYLDPPQNALVLAVDEKPSIQALERKQGYLKLANGRALTGRSHDYKWHGTTTLFAAFDVATGKVTGRHYKRRRRIEFLDFMNRIVKNHRDREIHVILDNLNTHKPKEDRWLGRHANVHFHFTPTKASWLNQVEIWFSILAGKALAGASFASVAELRRTSKPSSTPTMKQPNPSPGRNPKSIRNASSRVSRINDSGCYKTRCTRHFANPARNARMRSKIKPIALAIASGRNPWPTPTRQ